MEPQDISAEAWRCYRWTDHLDRPVEYTISDPHLLYVGKTTHRVVDMQGIVHCVPNIGYFGCVLRWSNRDAKHPVQF